MTESRRGPVHVSGTGRPPFAVTCPALQGLGAFRSPRGVWNARDVAVDVSPRSSAHARSNVVGVVSRSGGACSPTTRLLARVILSSKDCSRPPSLAIFATGGLFLVVMVVHGARPECRVITARVPCYLRRPSTTSRSRRPPPQFRTSVWTQRCGEGFGRSPHCSAFAMRCMAHRRVRDAQQPPESRLVRRPPLRQMAVPGERAQSGAKPRHPKEPHHGARTAVATTPVDWVMGTSAHTDHGCGPEETKKRAGGSNVTTAPVAERTRHDPRGTLAALCIATEM